MAEIIRNKKISRDYKDKFYSKDEDPLATKPAGLYAKQESLTESRRRDLYSEIYNELDGTQTGVKSGKVLNSKGKPTQWNLGTATSPRYNYNELGMLKYQDDIEKYVPQGYNDIVISVDSPDRLSWAEEVAAAYKDQGVKYQKLNHPNTGLILIPEALQEDCNVDEDYLSVEEYSDLDSQNGNAFWIMGYTANAMKEQGLSNEIGEMRERAMSGDYDNLVKVCNEYLTRCNELYDEIDDEYKVEGLEFVTQGLNLSEDLNEEAELPDIGARLRIITMQGEPNYDGKEGEVLDIDDIGQIHGTWGGLAIVPEVDKYEVI